MFGHFKELLLLVAELVPVWILIRIATRKGSPEEQSKRLLLIIGLIVFMGITAFVYGWLSWAD